MRKIIAIGESVLDIQFDCNDKPVKSFVGGRVANAAALLGKEGLPVYMVSECCSDHTGDIVVKFFEDNGVDTKSIDRYTEGATAVSLMYAKDGQNILSNYVNYPSDRFDVVWPRIDEDDVILFGSKYSIDGALRERLFEMVKYAVERKTIIIYLPGCQHGLDCRITKVMPAILENFEISNIVVANRSDIETIFPGEGPDKAFKNHIEYYDAHFLFIDDDYNVSIYSRNDKVVVPAVEKYNGEGFMWQSRFVSSLIGKFISDGITAGELSEVSQQKWKEMVAASMTVAGGK